MDTLNLLKAREYGRHHKLDFKKHVGFTGTRGGMTKEQALIVSLILEETLRFHHGMCIGSDEQAHKIAREFTDRCWIKGHPCDLERFRVDSLDCDELAPVKRPLDRDRDIVDESHVLVATPKSEVEYRRSGTWYTIRYAVKTGKPVIIIYPNGRLEIR